MGVTLEEGTTIASLTAGNLGFAANATLPTTTIDILDGLAQAGAVASAAVSTLAPKNPKATITAAVLSAVGEFTGQLKLKEDFANLSSSDQSTQLTFLGDAVTVLGDLFGMLAPLAASKPTLKSFVTAANAILAGVGLTIAASKLTPTALAKVEATIVGSVTYLNTSLSAVVAAGTWPQTVGALITALNDISSLVSSINSGNYQSVTAAANAILNDVNTANGALFSFIGLSTDVSPSITESAGTNGVTTVTAGDGSFTATGSTNTTSGFEFSSYNLSTSYPYTISGTDTLNPSGSETLAAVGQAGPDSASQTTQTNTSGAVSSQQTMFDAINITTPLSDPVDLTTDASGSLVAEVPSSTPGDDVTVESASDGSDQILIGDPTGTTSQQVIDYASGGLVGDTISIADANNGVVDVTTDVGSGDTAIVASDNAVSDVSQDFAFSGTGESLEIDNTGTFAGTISNFAAGDTIDLAGIGTATDGTIGANDVLTLAGGTVNLNLDSTQDYSADSFLMATDGNGGTEVIAESDAQTVVFTGTNEELLIVDPASFTGTITNFVAGDTIDLAGVSATNASLTASNVFTVQEGGGGSLRLNVASVQDNLGFSVIPDGAGGTDILVGHQGYIVITESGTITAELDGSNSLIGEPFTLTTTFDPSTAVLETPNDLLLGSGSTNFTSATRSITDGSSDIEYTEDTNFTWGSTGSGIEVNALEFSTGSTGSLAGSLQIPNPLTVSGTYSTNVLPAGNTFYLFSELAEVSTEVRGIITDLTITGATPPSCYVAGTRIGTLRGYVAVEEITPGDVVHAHFAGVAHVKWIGFRKVKCSRQPNTHQVWPVRVRAGAFGDGMPHRDLWLSPDHAVFVDDVLIPIKRLINGISIEQVPMDEVTYYHIELPQHDVLMAEGLPAESYLDTGDRFNFENDGGPIALHPEFSKRRWDTAHIWEALGCARLIVTGPELETVRQRVNSRAARVGPAALPRQSEARAVHAA